jgi:maltose/moltooligosaccharide transporter
MFIYSAGSVGAGAFFAFNNFALPFVLKNLGANDLITGLLSSTRSLEGAIIQPTVGAFSDRIWTPFGRRRPFIAVAIPLCALFFVLAALADSLLPLAAAIIVFSLFFNVALDPYAALLPDIAPATQRGLLSGLSSAVQLISQVTFLLLLAAASQGSGAPAWTYVLVGGILVASFGITALGIREPAARTRATSAERVPLAKYFRAVLDHRQAARYLGIIFLYQFGWNAVFPYLTLFIRDVIGETEQTAYVLAGLALIVTAIAVVAFGKLADRIGTRPVLAVGWAMLAIGAAGGILITTLPQTVAVVLVVGIGNGAASVVMWPLLTLLIPQEKMGIFAGLMASAQSIAIPLSIVVAAQLFLPYFGYRGMFAMLTVNIVLALLLLMAFIRVPSPATDPA